MHGLRAGMDRGIGPRHKLWRKEWGGGRTTTAAMSNSSPANGGYRYVAAFLLPFAAATNPLLTTFRHHDIPSHLFVLTSLNTAVVLVQGVRAETEKQSGDPIPSLLLCLLSDGGCNSEIKEASLPVK